MPTLTCRRFDYSELKRRLNPDDRILILSCNACARLSDGLGGERGLQTLADKLTADGFNVYHHELLAEACSSSQLTDALQNAMTRNAFEDADITIPLACQAGEDRLRESLPAASILSVTKTVGKGTCYPEAGARLTEPAPGVELKVDDPNGLPLAEAAKRLGLHSGSF